MEKESFPEFNVNSLDGHAQYYASPTNMNGNGNSNGNFGPPPSADRWQSRRDSSRMRSPSSPWVGSSLVIGNSGMKGHSHVKQKSLGDALRIIRTRKGSVSANVHEIGYGIIFPSAPFSCRIRKTVNCKLPLSPDQIIMLIHSPEMR